MGQGAIKGQLFDFYDKAFAGSNNIASVSDIVCSEHKWRLATAPDWFSNYQSERFMGFSSNDTAGVMGHGVEDKMALREAVGSWQNQFRSGKSIITFILMIH
ncbi:MAG: hypothetical protein ACRD99_05485, partial [Nitrososphaera sp.]